MQFPVLVIGISDLWGGTPFLWLFAIKAIELFYRTVVVGIRIDIVI